MSLWLNMMNSTMDIYRQVQSVDAGIAPVQSYTLYQSNVPCSAQPQNDTAWDPLADRKVYKQVLKVYYDTVSVDISPTDRIRIGTRTYEQTGTPDDQIDAIEVTRMDLREVTP